MQIVCMGSTYHLYCVVVSRPPTTSTRVDGAQSFTTYHCIVVVSVVPPWTCNTLRLWRGSLYTRRLQCGVVSSLRCLWCCMQQH